MTRWDGDVRKKRLEAGLRLDELWQEMAQQFGVCPHCHGLDGYYLDSRGRNWLFCHNDKTRWRAVRFANWWLASREQALYAFNEHGDYQEVQPAQSGEVAS